MKEVSGGKWRKVEESGESGGCGGSWRIDKKQEDEEEEEEEDGEEKEKEKGKEKEKEKEEEEDGVDEEEEDGEEVDGEEEEETTDISQYIKEKEKPRVHRQEIAVRETYLQHKIPILPPPS